MKNTEMNTETTGHVYEIKDVHTSLRASLTTYFLSLFFIGIFGFIGAVLGFYSAENLLQAWKFAPLILMPLIVVQYIMNSYYKIDTNTGDITIPRTDVENSILQILLLAPYWNNFRRITINAEDVQAMNLDTVRAKNVGKTRQPASYNVNISGTFGSAKLEFGSRQKRDEVRNAISQAVKAHGGKNLSFQVAEFG